MHEQIEAVQRMQDYIEAHLYEEITPAQLASVSLYSPWHSYRLFVRWIEMTPADYIRKLRLSKSALRLRDEQTRIIDIALDSGFNSVDGYQRAFCREFGCNPGEYAKSPVPLYLFTPFGIKTAKNRKDTSLNTDCENSQSVSGKDTVNKEMENVKSVFIQVIEKPQRKALVKRGVNAEDYFTYCEEVGCDIWGLLVSMKSLCGEPVCMWLPDKYIKPGTSKYVQGVEVPMDYDGVIPDGFDIIELPAARYMQFQGEPFAEEDFEKAIQYIWSAIDRYNPNSAGYSWDEENPRIQLEPRGERGYIELIAVKPL